MPMWLFESQISSHHQTGFIGWKIGQLLNDVAPLWEQRIVNFQSFTALKQRFASPFQQSQIGRTVACKISAVTRVVFRRERLRQVQTAVGAGFQIVQVEIDSSPEQRK